MSEYTPTSKDETEETVMNPDTITEETDSEIPITEIREDKEQETGNICRHRRRNR